MMGFIDAAKLSELCSAEGSQARDGRSICLGYITGSVDQLLGEQAEHSLQSRTICVPAAVTAQQVTYSVVLYAEWTKVPGASAAGVVKFALEEAYPCDDDDRLIM
jgi:hypothetical protein